MGPFDRPDRFPERLRIAVLTDDHGWGDAVSKHFAGIGREAVVVEGTDELQRRLDENSVDVILLDQPSDDVWEFCFDAQKQSDTMSPVLAVVRPEEDSNEMWAEAGADISVPSEAKDPVDVEDFLRAYFSKLPDHDR
ncbi:MAG: hypothetical protein QOF36_1326 [Microbacteriaceae bacterium]|nr:hypothetical protein [Microbacteriaceae bacterium]